MKVFAKDGEFELGPELVRSLASTYPAVNVRRELERMYLWTLKNPARRWELPLRGIESWLRRENKKSLERRASKTTVKQQQMAYAEGARTLRPVSEAWWTSNDGVEKRGRELGVEPKRGESYADFKSRVGEADKMARSLKRA